MIGFFYGFLGVCFVGATLLIYPLALKLFSFYRVCLYGLFGLGIFECLLCFLSIPWLFWLDIVVVATFNILAWTPLLTIFSNCVDASKQGWVMGIFSSMVAVGFIVAGFSANLLTLMGSQWVIFIGGLLALVSAFLLIAYNRLHPDKKS